MSGATAFRCSNLEAFLRALGGAAGVPCELGKAEDDRLTQPARITWSPIERSGRIRECTTLYEDGVVYRERSFQYAVKCRGQDVAASMALEARLMNALVTLGATEPAVEVDEGDFNPFSAAAEQGALVEWKIRVWEPIYYQRYQPGHIETTTTGIETVDQFNQDAGSIP